MFRLPPLTDHWFAMTFDLAGRPVTVRRTGATSSKVTVRNEPTEAEPIPGDEQTITNAAWKRQLAHETFGINAEGNGSPSYRSAVSYFARRQSAGGFQTPTKHFSMQSLGDLQVNLSLLLGIDTQLPRKWQEVRDRESHLKALRAAAVGGALGQVVGQAGELASELAGAEDELTEIVESVENFTVIPVYRVVEEEVTVAGRLVRQLNNQIVSDREYLDQLRHSIGEVEERPTVGLQELFAAAEVQLPEVALAAFRDVQVFHESVISNRRLYLAAELERIEDEIQSATQQRDELARRRSVGMGLLSSRTFLDKLIM